jgi:hypothetical protein
MHPSSAIPTTSLSFVVNLTQEFALHKNQALISQDATGAIGSHSDRNGEVATDCALIDQGFLFLFLLATHQPRPGISKTGFTLYNS